jgi:hypothetical protein
VGAQAHCVDPERLQNVKRVGQETTFIKPWFKKERIMKEKKIDCVEPEGLLEAGGHKTWLVKPEFKFGPTRKAIRQVELFPIADCR